MMQIEFNDADLQRSLQRLADGLGDLTPVMQEIVEFMVTSTKDRFATGAAPDGTPWAPKSEVTKAAYRRRGYPVDDRPLFGPSGALHGGIFGQAGPDWAEWGSPMIYAAVMQLGAGQGAFGAFMGKDRLGRDHFHHIPWGDIPARPFLGVSETDKAGLQEIVTEYLVSLAQPG